MRDLVRAAPNRNLTRSARFPRTYAPAAFVGRPGRQTKATVSFRVPEAVLICVRRKRRKEVIHALGVAGARGLRKPRRSEFSEISCRRS